MNLPLQFNLRRLRWRLRVNVQRVRHGLKYALGRLSQDDAQWMFCALQHTTGWYPLSILSVDDVLAQAAERYEITPQIEGFAASACARVHNKWSGTGDDVSAAEKWAMDLIRDYAASEGIVLRDLSDDADGLTQAEMV